MPKAHELPEIPLLALNENTPTNDADRINNFLYGRSTSLKHFVGAMRKPSDVQCGGMDLNQLNQDRNLQSFWTIETFESAFIIRPQNINLLPCEPLSHAKFSVALQNDPSESDFHFPLGYAVPNKTIPGIYHVRGNLKPTECIPSRKYIVSVKLDYAFMHETPKDKMEFFGHLDVETVEQYIAYNNESTQFPGSESAIFDMSAFQCHDMAFNTCTTKQLETLRVYRDATGLNPTECKIPQLWYEDLLETPPTLCPGGKCKTDQWIHIVGDSNSNYLFNQLVSEKLLVSNCFRDWGFPAHTICVRDLTGRGKRKGDITVLVFTHWYMDPDSHQPQNAFEGMDLVTLLDSEPYKRILPQFQTKKEKHEFLKPFKRMGLPTRTIVSMGSHYDHQTPNAMNITLTNIFNRMAKTKEWNHYKATTLFVSETPVLTSEFPPKYGTLLHQNNARISERNRVILATCRKHGFKFIDIYEFAKAQNVWMEPGDGLHFKSGKEGYVYNRMVDSYFLEMGYHPKQQGDSSKK
ncbi:UNVERIFIED_CONTAM: hypothetical protein HDU68_004268 [Siphonaria sp. JEL0065]|nr:hypothetical protein HDU68_004268 [Siphonaria sp. JEL0065]